MSFDRDPWREFLAGGRGRPPPFVLALLLTLAAGCVADSFWELRPVLEALRLSPGVWERSEVWRLVTYGWVGSGGISAWSLLHLVLVYWLLMELVARGGLRRTRIVLLGGIVIASSAAVAAQIVSDASGGPHCALPFWMMQGQSTVTAIAIASFAAANRYSTVAHTPFLFGLRVPSRWLIPLQLLYALASFAATRDVGGLVGIVTATVWGVRAGARWR